MPKENEKRPKPSKILSTQNLHATWKFSRDSKTQAGARGGDGISARSFAANLDSNIRRVASDIKQGDFYFSKLRPYPISKQGSDKKRLICIPTIKDRLVQRRISFHLHDRRLLPIYNSSSFGFIPEEGVRKALIKTIEYREKYYFCFETDIIGFFDSIDRERLAKKLKEALGKHSLYSIIAQAINAEVGPTRDCSEQDLIDLGIRKGVGIRQGMPLSPILSNLALSEFDLAVQKRNIPMVRYADDIVTFGKTKSEAEANGYFIRDELQRCGHKIPELGSGSKTNLVGKSEPITFLGREILFSEREGRFIQRISSKKLTSILERMERDSTLPYLLRRGLSYADVSRVLSQTVASYVNSYRDAHNASHVENELRATAKKIIRSIYAGIFGEDRVANVTKEYAKFLGFDTLDIAVAETFDVY